MAKFIPIFGEVATGIESAGKLVAAGVTAPFNRQAAKKLLKASGDAWGNYGKEGFIPCAIRGDGTAIKKGFDDVSKGFPVVAHVRGVVHIVRGEREEAYECMANGTKAAGVMVVAVVATAATGGMAAGPAMAIIGTSAAGTQVALDGADTGIRSAAAGEFRPAGTIQGVQRAVQTGDAVHIADAIIAPVQTGAMSAGAAGVARAWANYRYNAAQGENIAGTGQSMNGEAPPTQANPKLTPDNLAKLPKGPRPGMPEGPPAPPRAPLSESAPHGATPTIAESTTAGATGSISASSISDISDISLISDAYPKEIQTQLCDDNPPTLLDKLGKPTKAVQHAFDKHSAQINLPEGFPMKWNQSVGLRFVAWLRDQIKISQMHDVTYRGVTGHRLFFNARNNLGVVMKVGAHGCMDLVAAFPLSPAQLRHVLSQGGRMN